MLESANIRQGVTSGPRWSRSRPSRPLLIPYGEAFPTLGGIVCALISLCHFCRIRLLRGGCVFKNDSSFVPAWPLDFRFLTPYLSGHSVCATSLLNARPGLTWEITYPRFVMSQNESSPTPLKVVAPAGLEPATLSLEAHSTTPPFRAGDV